MRSLRRGIAFCALGGALIVASPLHHGGLVSAGTPNAAPGAERLAAREAVEAERPGSLLSMNAPAVAFQAQATPEALTAPRLQMAANLSLLLDAEAVPQGKLPSRQTRLFPWRDLLAMAARRGEGEPEGAAWWMMGLARRWFGEGEGAPEAEGTPPQSAELPLAQSCRFPLEPHAPRASAVEGWAQLQLIGEERVVQLLVELPGEGGEVLLLCDAPPEEGGQCLLELPLDGPSAAITLTEEESALLHAQDRVWMLVTSAPYPEGWLSGWWRCDAPITGNPESPADFELRTALAVKEEEPAPAAARRDKPNFPEGLPIRLPICDIPLYHGPTPAGYVAALVDPESSAVNLYIDHGFDEAVSVVLREYVGEGQEGPVLADLGLWPSPPGEQVSIGHIPYGAMLLVGELDFYIEVSAQGTVKRADPSHGCGGDMSLEACHVALTPEQGQSGDGQLVRITNTLSDTTWLYLVHTHPEPQFLLFYGEADGEGEAEEELLAVLPAPPTSVEATGVLSSTLVLCCPNVDPTAWHRVVLTGMPPDEEGEGSPEGEAEGNGEGEGETEGGPEGANEGSGEGEGEGEATTCYYECPDWEDILPMMGPPVMGGVFDCGDYEGPMAERPVVFVDATNTGGAQDGTTRHTAFRSIQEAVDLAAQMGGADVWVAAGFYTGLHAIDGGCLVALEMRDNVHIYGGFPPGGGPWSSRDWLKHQTWIVGVQGSISLTEPPSAYADHVVMADGIVSATLDGVYIAGGQAGDWSDDSPEEGEDEGDEGESEGQEGAPLEGELEDSGCTDARGAGLFIRDTGVDVAFRRLTITRNSAKPDHNGNPALGAGIYIENSASRIESSRILGNRAEGHAGGIFIEGGAPYLDNLLVVDNEAFAYEELIAQGAGIYVSGMGAPIIANSTITGNHAQGVSGVYDDERTEANKLLMLKNSIVWGNGMDDVGEGIEAAYTASGEELPGNSNILGNPLFKPLAVGRFSPEAETVLTPTAFRIDDIALSLEPNAFKGQLIVTGNPAQPSGLMASVITGNTDISISVLGFPGGATAPYWIMDYGIDPASPAVDFGYDMDPPPASAEGEGSVEGAVEGELEGETPEYSDEDNDFLGRDRGYDGDNAGAGNTGDGSDFDMGYLETRSLDHGEVLFPDPNLEEAVREALSLEPEETITIDLVADPAFTSLDASNRGIQNISGIEYCAYLQDLDLSGNINLARIDALRWLNYLTQLDLAECEVQDPSPLSYQVNLQSLVLRANTLTNLPENIDLHNIEYLDLGANQISDFAPLLTWSLSGAEINITDNLAELEHVCEIVEALSNLGNTVIYHGDCSEGATNFRVEVQQFGAVDRLVDPFVGVRYYPYECDEEGCDYPEVSFVYRSNEYFEPCAWQFVEDGVGWVIEPPDNPVIIDRDFTLRVAYRLESSEACLQVVPDPHAQVTVSAFRENNVVDLEPMLNMPDHHYALKTYEVAHLEVQVQEGYVHTGWLGSVWTGDKVLGGGSVTEPNVVQPVIQPLYTITVEANPDEIVRPVDFKIYPESTEYAKFSMVTIDAGYYLGRKFSHWKDKDTGVTLTPSPEDRNRLNLQVLKDTTVQAVYVEHPDLVCESLFTPISAQNPLQKARIVVLEPQWDTDHSDFHLFVETNYPSVTVPEPSPTGILYSPSALPFTPVFNVNNDVAYYSLCMMNSQFRSSLFDSNILILQGNVAELSSTMSQCGLKLDFDINGGGEVSAQIGGKSIGALHSGEWFIQHGELVVLQPHPKPGWIFDEWSGDVVPSSITNEEKVLGFIAESNRTITASFSRGGILTIVPDDHGLITVYENQEPLMASNNVYSVVLGDEYVLEPEADLGWVFFGWNVLQGNAPQYDNSTYNITITQNTVLQPEFRQLSQLEISQIGEGKVYLINDDNTRTELEPGTHDFPLDTIIRLFASPTSGWRFEDWEVTASPQPILPTHRRDLSLPFVAPTEVVVNFGVAPHCEHFTLSGEGAIPPTQHDGAASVSVQSDASGNIVIEVEHDLENISAAKLYFNNFNINEQFSVEDGNLVFEIPASLYDTLLGTENYSLQLFVDNETLPSIGGKFKCSEYLLNLRVLGNGDVQAAKSAETLATITGDFMRFDDSDIPITLLAEPDAGNYFSHWSRGGNWLSASAEIMHRDAITSTYEANFSTAKNYSDGCAARLNLHLVPSVLTDYHEVLFGVTYPAEWEISWVPPGTNDVDMVVLTDVPGGAALRFLGAEASEFPVDFTLDFEVPEHFNENVEIAVQAIFLTSPMEPLLTTGVWKHNFVPQEGLPEAESDYCYAYDIDLEGSLISAPVIAPLLDMPVEPVTGNEPARYLDYDCNQDSIILLGELLQVVMIYNNDIPNAPDYICTTGAIAAGACQYEPAPLSGTSESQECGPIDADLNGDWHINLSELLLVIQAYSYSSGYCRLNAYEIVKRDDATESLSEHFVYTGDALLVSGYPTSLLGFALDFDDEAAYFDPAEVESVAAFATSACGGIDTEYRSVALGVRCFEHEIIAGRISQSGLTPGENPDIVVGAEDVIISGLYPRSCQQ